MTQQLLICLLSSLSIGMSCYALLEMYIELGQSDLAAMMEENPKNRTGVQKLFLNIAAFIGNFLATIFIPPQNLVDSKSKNPYKRIIADLDRISTSAGRPYDIDGNEIIGSMVMSGLGGMFCGVYIGSLTSLGMGISIIFSASLGSIIPFIWLNDKRKYRQKRIFKALPYSIDLMTLSVEAGLDFSVSLSKISEKLPNTPLGEEFVRVVSEINLGKSRTQSLKDMADRVDLQDMNSFTNAIIQADELGTNMGPVLKVQSDLLREKRSQAAEKKAMEAPVKIIFPLALFIFPVVMILMFGSLFISYIS